MLIARSQGQDRYLGPGTDTLIKKRSVVQAHAGPIEKGHKPVTDTMRWVGSRFTGADAVDVEHAVIASSGDLAYTVGFERSHVSVDGGPPRDMVIPVTHIYRRIDGDWKLVHRHADFPPSDPRKTSAR